MPESLLDSYCANSIDGSRRKALLMPDIWLCIITHLSRASLPRLSRISTYFMSLIRQFLFRKVHLELTYEGTVETLELICRDGDLARCIVSITFGGSESEYSVPPTLCKDRETTYHPNTPDLMIGALKKMRNLRSLKFCGPVFGQTHELRFIEAIKDAEMSLESFVLEDRRSHIKGLKYPRERRLEEG